MPRLCSICTHPRRAEIDAGLAALEPFRHIAIQCATSTGALQRHKLHLAKPMAAAAVARGQAELVHGSGLLDKVAGLEADARRLAAHAEASGDVRTALAAVRELTRIVELLAKLQGELRDGLTLNLAVVASPEWQGIRGRLLRALEAHPDARLAVVAALEGA